MTTIDEDLLPDEHDDIFHAFFNGAISEKKFHVALKRFGYDQDDIDEMRDLWFIERQRHESSPLFARAAEILMALPLEDRKDLRDILRRLLAELPGRSAGLADMMMQGAFYDTTGGITPDEEPVQDARMKQIMDGKPKGPARTRSSTTAAS